jgi:AsmA protein
MSESGGEARHGSGISPVRILRWAFGMAAAVVLLAMAAALAVTLVVNPDRYKGAIESAVQRQTGRPFTLQGHLRLTWFPWLGLLTGAARLGNPPGAVGPDLIDWQSAQIRVRLLPLLLHRRLEVGRIRIVGADIHLIRSAAGRGSWEDLVARLSSGGQSREAPGVAPAGTPAATASSPTLAGLDLEQSSLEYVDEHIHEHVNLADWQLSIGPWSAGEPLSLRTRFMLHADAPAAGGGLRLPAAGVAVSLDVPRLSVGGTPVEAAAPRWSLQVGDAKLEGAVDASRNAAGLLTASGSLTAAVPSLRQLAQTLGVGLPVLEDPAVPGPLSLSARWSYRSGGLEIRPLAAKLDSTSITGWVAYSGAWTFALRADRVDLGRYLAHSNQQKPLELPVSALRALHVQGTLQLDHAQIDGTLLEGARLQVQ